MNQLSRLARRWRTELIAAACIGAVLTAIMLSGRASQPKGIPFAELKAGMVVEVNDEAFGDKTRLKVVKVERQGVHVVMYDQDTKPTTMNDGTKVSMDRMHLPLSVAFWNSMKSHRVKTEKVKPEELGGYRAWKQSNGGYWDADTLP